MDNMITKEELTLITGATATDARFNYLQKVALDILADSLGVLSFYEHQIALEPVNSFSPDYILTNAFPADVSTFRIYDACRSEREIEGYTFRRDPYNMRKFYVLFNGVESFLPYDKILLSYIAGFLRLSTLEVLSNELTGETITVEAEGVTTVYTFIATGEPTAIQILIGGSATATAANIATKLGGTSSDEVVSLALGQTIPEVSDIAKLEAVNSDLPYDIKTCVAFMVAGGLLDTANSANISSYSIGSKTVNFRSNTEGSYVMSAIKKYASQFKKSLILS